MLDTNIAVIFAIPFLVLEVEICLILLSSSACEYIKANTKLFKELHDGEYYASSHMILCAKKCYQLKKKGIEINGIETEEDINKLYEECVNKKLNKLL